MIDELQIGEADIFPVPQGNDRTLKYLSPGAQEQVTKRYHETRPPDKPSDWTTVRQVAEETGINEHTLKSRIHRVPVELADQYGVCRMENGEDEMCCSSVCVPVITRPVRNTTREAMQASDEPQELQLTPTPRRRKEPKARIDYRQLGYRTATEIGRVLHIHKKAVTVLFDTLIETQKLQTTERVRFNLEGLYSSTAFEAMREYVESGDVSEIADQLWAPATNFIRSTGGNQRSWYPLISQLLTEHVEWFIGKEVGESLWISPKAQQALRATEYGQRMLQLAALPDATTGWITVMEFWRQHGGQYPNWHEIADSMREAHPEWFMTGRSNANKEAEFISPELQEHFRQTEYFRQVQAIHDLPEPPKHWHAVGTYADANHLDLDKVRKVVEAAAEVFPEHVLRGRRRGTKGLFFDPELLPVLQDEFK